MRLWAALALAAALAAAKKTESSQGSQDTKYEIDKLQALVDNKKTLFDSLEATLRRASESDGAAAEAVGDRADEVAPGRAVFNVVVGQRFDIASCRGVLLRRV